MATFRTDVGRIFFILISEWKRISILASVNDQWWKIYSDRPYIFQDSSVAAENSANSDEN